MNAFALQRRDFLKTAGTIAAATALRTYGQTPGQAAQVRPLFFTEERIARFKTRLQQDVPLQARWQRLIARADASTRDRPPSLGDASTPTAANASASAAFQFAAGRLSQIAWTLGLAYRVTGERRYAEVLRDGLKLGLTAPRWNRPGMLNRRPPWHGDLTTAGIVVGYAAGREALGDFLSSDERREIGAGMLRLGIEPLLRDWVLPETRIHALDSMGHNWWSVCIAGAGVGALALIDEEPRARAWLREIDTSLDEFFAYQGHVLHNKPANFDPDGAFYESVGYAEYALFEYMIYRLARTNVIASPASRIPVLDRAGEFFVHALYPATTGALSLNFGDSNPRSGGVRSQRLLAAMGHAPELAKWYLDRKDRDSADPLAMLYYDDRAVVSRNELPLSKAYYGIGWAMLRTAWTEDATLLAVRCGDSWNHAHSDAGSFILYHGGVPLLIDSGTCSYSRREYSDYYRESRAHNVVLFNGEGQPREDVHERGAKIPGKLHDLIDGLGVKYLYADATGPMALHFKRNYRHWLWVHGVVLVFDDILAHREGRFDWLLHYAGEARRSDERVVEIVNGQAAARVTMLYPPAIEIREEKGLTPERPDEPMTFLALTPSQAAKVQKFIVAIIPRPADANTPLPQVELLQNAGMSGSAGVIGARVRTATETTDIYLNLEADGRRMHLNSNQTIDGWETDAYLLAFTRPASAAVAEPENVSRYVMVFGSYLRRADRQILTSFSKVTTVFQSGPEVEVLLHGQPTVDISLASSAPPRTLRVNGTPTRFEHDAGKKMIRFRVAGQA